MTKQSWSDPTEGPEVYKKKKKDKENNPSLSLFIFPFQETLEPTLVLEAYLTLESIFVKT